MDQTKDLLTVSQLKLKLNPSERFQQFSVAVLEDGYAACRSLKKTYNAAGLKPLTHTTLTVLSVPEFDSPLHFKPTGVSEPTLRVP